MPNAVSSDLGYYEKTVEYAFLLQAVATVNFKSATPLAGPSERWFGDAIFRAERWVVVEFKASAGECQTDFYLKNGKWEKAFLESPQDLHDMARASRGLHYFVYAVEENYLEACDYFERSKIYRPATSILTVPGLPVMWALIQRLLNIRIKPNSATEIPRTESLYEYLEAMIRHREPDGRVAGSAEGDTGSYSRSRYDNMTVLGVDGMGRLVAVLPVHQFRALSLTDQKAKAIVMETRMRSEPVRQRKQKGTSGG